MSNHFHILVEIPPKCDRQLSDEALLDRLPLLYSNDYVAQVREHLEVLAKQKHDAGRKAYWELREKFTCRMWDLGLFMKTLKQLICYRTAQALQSGLSSSGKQPYVELRYAA